MKFVVIAFVACVMMAGCVKKAEPVVGAGTTDSLSVKADSVATDSVAKDTAKADTTKK